MCYQSGIMKRMLVVFSKDTRLTLMQISWNGELTKKTIFIQHTKTIIIDVPKYGMPQRDWKKMYLHYGEKGMYNYMHMEMQCT